MRPLLFALLVLAVPAAAAQPGVQRAERLPVGFARAGYRVPGEDTSDARLDVTVHLGDLAVRRRIEYPAEDDTVGVPVRRFTLTKAGRVIADWPGDYSGAWDEGFDVLHGDLDGDGAREVLLVQHVGTGNGLGVATWEVRLLPETGGVAPLRFLTVDYGPTGLVVRRPGGLRLMAASWEGGTEPGRGEGLYYTARFYRYADGRLVPEAPILQRRFLFSFQALRGREAEAGRYHPDRWIARGVRRVTRDPVVPAGRPLASEVVTVEAFVRYEGYRVRFADGRVETRPGELIGDAATGLLYPWGYAPLGAGEDWPKGRSVRLDAFPGPYGDDRLYVLWLTR